MLVMAALPVAAQSPREAASLASAIETGKAEQRSIVALFAHTSIPASEELARELWSPERMGDLLDRVTLVRLDPYDHGEGTHEALRRSVRNVPTILLFDGTGVEIDRLSDAPLARDLRRLLEECLGGQGPLGRLRAREREHLEDLDVALALGRELMSRGATDEALARFERVSAQASDRQENLRARALYDIGLLQLRREELAEAEATLRAILDTHPDAAVITDAELALAQLLAITGRKAEAVRVLEKLRLAHPGNAQEPEVLALMERLHDTR